MYFRMRYILERVSIRAFFMVKRLTHVLKNKKKSKWIVSLLFYHFRFTWNSVISSCVQSKYAKQSTGNTYLFLNVHAYDDKIIMEVRKNAHAIHSLSLLFVRWCCFFSFIFVAKLNKRRVLLRLAFTVYASHHNHNYTL